MIRALIGWVLRRFLARYVSSGVADKIVGAIDAFLDDVKSRGDTALPTSSGEKPFKVEMRRMTPEEEKRWFERVDSTGG